MLELCIQDKIMKFGAHERNYMWNKTGNGGTKI